MPYIILSPEINMVSTIHQGNDINNQFIIIEVIK